MAATKAEGPDLTHGVAEHEVPQGGMLAGRVGDQSVLLAWVDGQIVAVGGSCSHYSAPLAKGLRVGDTVRCPWHHACFNLRTGETLEAPAFDALPRWKVERDGDRVRVCDTLPVAAVAKPALDPAVRRIVVVGGGAAGFAAIQRLRALGYDGAVTLVSQDPGLPYDRTKLSKDYLADKARADGLPLKDASFYRDHQVSLRLATAAERLDLTAREVSLAGGERLGFDALLLAMGAAPNRPDTPGFDRPNVYVLRSRADSDALIAAAGGAKRVAVIGASFIGLEAAASLRQRGLDVHVVETEAVPLAARMGPQIGAFVQGLHEAKGVVFHLGRKAVGFDGAVLTLDAGAQIQADFLVLGVGVRPRVSLAAEAGLQVDRGVKVCARMRTTAPGVYAAGDIAEYPDPISGQPTRVEHWVAAERQGQIAAANMVGREEAMLEPAFFWSGHYGVSIRHVGHADGWDRIEIDGSLADKDAAVRFIKDGQVRALATVGRDMEALSFAQAMREAG